MARRRRKRMSEGKKEVLSITVGETAVLLLKYKDGTYYFNI